MALHFAEYYGSAVFGLFGLVSLFCLKGGWRDGGWMDAAGQLVTAAVALGASGVLGFIALIT